ncbi:MAG: ribosome silencing factor [Lachnospiraceae bacterium]|nr:ribosome silencing factor [Lachnospiraceae bacterium]MBQ7507360.1 ribosome silencing factor [Lachnospiraceae bacterium]
MELSAAKMAKCAYEALAEKKGEDITIVDISEISPIADYFLIAGGSSAVKRNAMTDAVEEAMARLGAEGARKEGNGQSTWILLDYKEIIVHIFSDEDRSFYDLERVWRDGKRISPEEL